MYKANASTPGAGTPPTDGASAAGGTTDQKKDEGVIDAEYVDVEPNK
jgi:molecular chaperone DnaK